MNTTCVFGGCDRQAATRARFSRPCGHGNHLMDPEGPVIREICAGHAEATVGGTPGRPSKCATCGEVNSVIVTPLINN